MGLIRKAFFQIILVDDCDEDLIPPVILITETLEVTTLDKFPNAVYIPSHIFPTIEDGRIFLFDNARYTDDCNKQLDIDVSTPDAAC
eukprot:1242057-Ditylum_brightwellii.AAC.1